MKDFCVGAAKNEITPALGCLLYGYPVERHAERVLDKLSIGAIAIRQNAKALLLISAEICCVSKETCDGLRKTVADAVGVGAESVFFFTTHTHSGPITRTSAGWGDADEAYITDILTPGAVQVAREAMANLSPAEMAIGSVESLVGINRREMTPQGNVILGQNPDGPYDPTMTVLRFQSLTGQPIGSIVHFAVHPTSAGVNLSITRDWPGYMVDRIEEISGAMCIYINGAEGDIGPRLSNGRTTGDDSYVEEIGRIAEVDVQKAFESATEFFVPELHIHTDKVVLPFSKPPYPEEVDKRLEALGDPRKLIEVDVTKYAQLSRIKRMYETGEVFPEGVTLDQTVVALGEYAMIPAPFEAFCEVAIAISEGSPYKKTLFLGLTNGGYGYLPTSEQIPYGGYEVDSFHAAGVTGFPDDTDKRFIDANIALLKQLFDIQNRK